ncbi:hypothetical protein G6F56_008986 [Rhizopus delemar]|nr:hypothetical protein G6F56_008986 [Rhizopus delemar]
MINGTKLLNVVGMSRGKRDGILKNEKGRVVVKVGAMHLKGVWITFSRAKDLATKFKIFDILYPLFVEDPSIFLSMPPPVASTTTSSSNNNTSLPYMLPSKGYYKNEYPLQQWGKQPSLPSLNQEMAIRSQPNGNVLTSEGSSENEMYMIQSPCEFRVNRTSAPPPPPPYSTYQFDNQFPYRKSSEKEEDSEKQINFPSSPPPEMKYQEYTANTSSSHLLETSKNGRSIQKGRKRMMDMNHLQNKRIKDKDFIQTP